MLWSRISPPLAGDILQTGRLKIDVAERRASLDGQSLSLSPLLFNLLLTLVRRQGRLVTRQELKLALWPYATRIDTERRLNTAMRTLRAALKDDAEAPRLIETVRGRGYRWIETGRPPGRAPRIVAAGLALVALVSAVSIGRPEPVNGEVGGAASILEAQSAIERWRSAPTAARLKQAAALVERAGQDNANPAIHILKGNLALEGRWDWAQAEAEFRRALSIEPSNADARQALAWLLANRGAKREALAHVHGLIGMAALNEDRRANLGWLLIRLDRPDLALAACAASRNSSVNNLSCMHTALARAGRLEEARAAALDLMAKLGARAEALEAVRSAKAETGYRRFLDWRVRYFLPDNASWFERAQVLADAGLKKEALDGLANAVAAREPSAVRIWSSASFAALRGDPRFRSLAMKVGVPA